MKSGIRALALFCVTMATMTGCNLMERRSGNCNQCSGPLGCRPCPVGWQRGGTDYGNHLGSHLARGHVGGHFAQKNAYAENNQVGSGVPAPATAYPYYTTRGPRDFFANNPPSIGR
jgi:hypothetical protein